MGKISDKTMQKSRRLPTFIFLISIVALIAGALIHYRFGYFSYDQSGHAWGVDDAYISYRYAQNLSLGHGLVFNPGERVEGYSNLLFVILASLLLSSGVGISQLYFAITLINLAVAVLMLIIFYKFLQSQFGNEKASIGALLLGISPLMWVWVAAGMEVPLVLLFQLFIWIATVRLEKQDSHIYTGVWIVATLLLCLTRADGFVLPVISLLFLALKRKYRLFILLLAVLLIVMGTYTFWRYSYYGQFLPNTYYAKVSGPIVQRVVFALALLAYIAVNQGFLGYLAAILQSSYSQIRENLSKHRPLFADTRFDAFASIGWLGYWLYIGGGTYLERFLMILIPFSIFALLSLIKKAPTREGWIMIAIFVLLPSTTLFIDRRFDYSTDKYDRRIKLGTYLNINHHGETLAVDAAGKISLYSGLFAMDMLGLNDPYIAHIIPQFISPGHNKFDPDYIFNRQPDLISAWIAACPEDDCNWLDLSYGLSEEKYQRQGYTLIYLIYTGKTPPGEWIVDVSKYDRQAKLELIDLGYIYGVLKRIDNTGFSLSR